MKIPSWVWLVGLAGVGYVIYRFANKIPQAANAATSAVAQGIADIWLNLPVVGLGQGQQILGSVQLPNGALVALQGLIGKIRQDSNGNTFANVNGTIYQLAPSDSSGNYPATLIGAAPAGG